MKFSVFVPGKPVAQGRPIAGLSFGSPRRVTMRDPEASRSWKAHAANVYRFAVLDAGLREPVFRDGALRARIVVVFPCLQSSVRKTGTVPRRVKNTRPDWDNLGKITCDAGNGILYRDDAQIVIGEVVKITGAQGEQPGVRITIEEIDEIDETKVIEALAELEA